MGSPSKSQKCLLHCSQRAGFSDLSVRLRYLPISLVGVKCSLLLRLLLLFGDTGGLQFASPVGCNNQEEGEDEDEEEEEEEVEEKRSSTSGTCSLATLETVATFPYFAASFLLL